MHFQNEKIQFSPNQAKVILDIEDYIEKTNKELKDENYYKKVSHDPIKEQMEIVNDTIETFHHNRFSQNNIAGNLKTTNVKTPHFQ